MREKTQDGETEKENKNLFQSDFFLCYDCYLFLLKMQQAVRYSKLTGSDGAEGDLCQSPGTRVCAHKLLCFPA